MIFITNRIVSIDLYLLISPKRERHKSENLLVNYRAGHRMYRSVLVDEGGKD